MNIEQLRAFVRRPKSWATRDKQIADYVKNIRMTERLDEATVEDMGAGPRTSEAASAVDRDEQGTPGSEAAASPNRLRPRFRRRMRLSRRVSLTAARDYARDYSKKLAQLHLHASDATL